MLVIATTRGLQEPGHYAYTCMYIYIYIYIEREREIRVCMYMCTYIDIYIYTHICYSTSIVHIKPGLQEPGHHQRRARDHDPRGRLGGPASSRSA